MAAHYQRLAILAMLAPLLLASGLVVGGPLLGLAATLRSWPDAAAWRALAQMSATSLALAILGVGIATGPALLLAGWIFRARGRRLAALAHRALAASAALPSIVVALAALMTFAPALAGMVAAPYSLVLAALGAGLFATPILALGLLAAARSGRARAEPAAAALGLSEDGKTFSLYLRCARGWALAAGLWTLLRLVGETMVVMMLSGNRLAWPVRPWQAVRAASADIALRAGETPPALWAPLHMEALGLVVMAVFLSLLARRLTRPVVRSRKERTA